MIRRVMDLICFTFPAW